VRGPVLWPTPYIHTYIFLETSNNTIKRANQIIHSPGKWSYPKYSEQKNCQQFFLEIGSFPFSILSSLDPNKAVRKA
jgi:hypothetical protein